RISATIRTARSRSSGGYLLDEPPDMTPSFPRTGVSGHAGAVQMGVQRAIEREIRRRYEAWRRQAEQARKAAEDELRKRGRERRPLDKLPPGPIPGTGGQPLQPFKPSR
ncbi:hypothetical protein, partial [Mycobacterium tuberculosis]|uniref:hypothetical protein n=3 Tax=Mycobacterium tuberculosis TaxID=1773 RepID=UPI001BE40F94